VIRVTDSPNGKLRYLIHGGTLHGSQSLDPARTASRLPTTRRPAGWQHSARHAGQNPPRSGAMLPCKLGRRRPGSRRNGLLSAPGESLTYYEIDPLVERMALDTRYFTFLEQCARRRRLSWAMRAQAAQRARHRLRPDRDDASAAT